MRRIIDPLPAGVAPFYSTDISSIVQKNYLDILSGIQRGNTLGAREGIVISGCEVTANGGNIDIAAGVVFMANEFYLMSAQTNVAAPQYATITTDVIGQRTFKDGTVQNFDITKRAQTSGSIPVSQYITFERKVTNHNVWTRYASHYGLANGWQETTTQPLEFRKNFDGTISWRGALIFNSDNVTSDTFISNLAPPLGLDLAPGDTLPAGGTGALHPGICYVSSGAHAGLQRAQAIGSFTAGIFQMSIPGISAADTSSTNRTVYIDITYSTVDF